MLCERAAREVKVVLSGDGGDETHLGYGRYQKHGRGSFAYGLVDRAGPLKRVLGRGPWSAVPWVRTAEVESSDERAKARSELVSSASKRPRRSTPCAAVT